MYLNLRQFKFSPNRERNSELGPTVSGLRKGHSITTSYGTLSVLRKLKNLVPLHEETPGRELYSPL